MSYQREYAKRLDIGIVGIGGHSYRNLLPAMNYLPVRIRAVCNKSNREIAKLTAEQYGCINYQDAGEMYAREKLDAVFICVSPRMHPGIAMKAFDAGMHVWMEKPPSMRTSEVEQMIARRGDRVAVVGLKKAFMPVTDKAIEIANSEKYGNLKTMLAVYPMHIPQDGKHVLQEGVMTDWLANGVHPLSFLLAVGGKVSSVTARCSKEGYGAFIIQFKNGVVGNLHLASGAFPMECYSLYGDKWHMDIRNNNRVVLHRKAALRNNNAGSFVPEGDDSGAVVWEVQNSRASLDNKLLFTQGFFSEMKYFCDCILENRKAERGSLEFALEVMRVYEAGLLSGGNTVNID